MSNDGSGWCSSIVEAFYKAYQAEIAARKETPNDGS